MCFSEPVSLASFFSFFELSWTISTKWSFIQNITMIWCSVSNSSWSFLSKLPILDLLHKSEGTVWLIFTPIHSIIHRQTDIHAEGHRETRSLQQLNQGLAKGATRGVGRGWKTRKRRLDKNASLKSIKKYERKAFSPTDNISRDDDELNKNVLWAIS